MTAQVQTDARRRSTVEDLHRGVIQMFGAERRLRVRDHARPGELTHAQLRALAALGREQELTAGQLARSADLNPATVTALLDQLEEINVVQRHRSNEDRRVCNVALTPEGWQLLERKRAAWHSLWDEHLADFSDSDLAAAVRVIHEIADIYNALSIRQESAETETQTADPSG